MPEENVPGTEVSEEDNDNIASMLTEIDSIRMAYIRKHASPDGEISENVDPKVLLKCMTDTATSLSRRQSQALAEKSEASLDESRRRALTLFEVSQQRAASIVGDPAKRKPRELPSLDDVADITFTEDEVAAGIVKLNPSKISS